MTQCLNICQNTSNSCFSSSLASVFDGINQIEAANAISQLIEESLKSQVGFSNRIDFSNAVMKNQKRVKGEQKLYYILKTYIPKYYVNILNDISEHVTLEKLMDHIGNVNHDIIFVGCWIFDSKYDKYLLINR